MKKLAVPLIFIYLAALHGSIAVMEIASWTLVAVCLYQKIRTRGAIWFPMWKPLLGLFLSVCIGLCLNPAGRTFVEQAGFMRWIVLLYFFAWLLADIWDEKFDFALRRFWVICLTVSGAYATLQCLTGIDLIRPDSHAVQFVGDVWRATGFFSMALTFAYCTGFSLMAISIPSLDLKPKIWTVLALTFGTLGLVSSLARGAWIGLVVATTVYFFLEHRRWFPWFVGALVGVGVVLTSFNSVLSNRLRGLIQLRMDHSEMMRWHLWQGYYAMWKDHPIWGVGLFQGDLLLPEYYQKLGIVEDFTSHSHDVLLGWLAGAGIVGLGFYLYVSFAFLRLAWRLRKVTPWGWSLFLAQIFLHVGGMTENNFFDGEVNHFEMFGWAMILALTYRHSKGQKV